MSKIKVKEYSNGVRIDDMCAVITDKQWREFCDMVSFGARHGGVVSAARLRHWQLALLSNDKLFNSKA